MVEVLLVGVDAVVIRTTSVTEIPLAVVIVAPVAVDVRVRTEVDDDAVMQDVAVVET